MNNHYIVYARTDENGIITAVNSSAFLADVKGWQKIDEGEGDRYHHAQAQYLPLGLTDEKGIYNYMLIGGNAVERTTDHKQPELDRINAAAEISRLKRMLAETDYIAAKLAEGAASKEEYADELAQRAAWRLRINELEGV